MLDKSQKAKTSDGCGTANTHHSRPPIPVCHEDLLHKHLPCGSYELMHRIRNKSPEACLPVSAGVDEDRCCRWPWSLSAFGTLPDVDVSDSPGSLLLRDIKTVIPARDEFLNATVAKTFKNLSTLPTHPHEGSAVIIPVASICLA